MRTMMLALSLLFAPVGAVATQYARVAIVAPSGGDYTSPIDAMSAVATWCGVNRTPATACLIKIMPGLYEHASDLRMIPYVDVEGSGENVTILRGTGPTTVSTSGLYGNGPAELRSLTIENTFAGSQPAAGVYANGGVALKLKNVTVRVTGVHDSYTNYAVRVASPGIDVVLDGVTATASGSTSVNTALAGVNSTDTTLVTGGSLTASGGSRAQAVSWGISSAGGALKIQSTTIRASGGTDWTDGVAANRSNIWLRDASVTADSATGVVNAIHSDGYGSPSKVHVDGSALVADHTAGGYEFYLYGWHATTFIANTRVEGLCGNYGDELHYVGLYDGQYAPTTCGTPP